jgi:ketosteroid isomerase-like protein
MSQRFLKFLYPLFVFAIMASQAAGGSDLDETREMIENINEILAKAVIAGDTVVELSYYTDDVISMPNYAEMVSGKEAFQKVSSEMRKAGMKVHSLNFATVDLWTCGDLVCEIGTYGISLTVPGVTHPVADNGKYLNIWEHQSDGSLRIKAEIWNTDVSPWSR